MHGLRSFPASASWVDGVTQVEFLTLGLSMWGAVGAMVWPWWSRTKPVSW
ncbi:hypothetical protein GA0070216_108197 [Micromonospora matsumotoense]|uniref:Uncharacterized protein n=1 Tax=Micromonospora matsumotoense TaxID=121616 RepID=A0A1C4Z6F2_9ACTN|nr:hypothetical protein GA0070216_108197 [Micromonospora matsumotoense]